MTPAPLRNKTYRKMCSWWHFTGSALGSAERTIGDFWTKLRKKGEKWQMATVKASLEVIVELLVQQWASWLVLCWVTTMLVFMEYPENIRQLYAK